MASRHWARHVPDLARPRRTRHRTALYQWHASRYSTGQYAGESLYYASLDAAEYRAQLTTHGFSTVAHRVEDPECGGRTVWLAQYAAR